MKEYTRIKLDTAAPRSPESSILVIYTGGTFGMGHAADGSYIPFNFENILKDIPSLQSFNIFIEVLSFKTPVDSSNIKPAHWIEIAEIIQHHYNEFDGFVVLHGTDTMAYTASALSYLLEGLQKPVIFTGAQLPVSLPRSDASENFITSLEIAGHKENGRPMVSEVCIYFDSELIRGNRAKKVESLHFDAFESENYPILAKAGISIEYNIPYLEPFVEGEKLTTKTGWSNQVTFLKLFPGLNKEIVQTLLSAPKLKGVILETFGNGNAPMDDWFIDLLRNNIENEVLVYNVSQCLGGKVIQGRYETSMLLDEIGVISGKDITSEAAITKMMYLLGNYSDRDEIKRYLSTSIRGEITV